MWRLSVDPDERAPVMIGGMFTKAGLVVALAALLAVGGFAGWQWLAANGLELRLSKCGETVAEQRTELAIQEASLQGLRGALQEQSAEVDRWEGLAAERQQAAALALQDAREAERQGNRAVERLRAIQGQDCAAAALEIREVLGI